MADRSHIEWTDATWNPVTGCTKVSQGCKHCYAERLSKRLQAMGADRYSNGFKVTLHPDLIDLPKRWRQPRRIFVNSMSDLFHELVPLDFIQRIFTTMHDCPQHIFQILTKRSARLRELAPKLEWPPNVWMGVSVEDARVVHRIDDLRTVPATVRFLSCEPLIGPLNDLPLEGIHWVIVGGESGPGARPMHAEWVRSIREQCRKAKVPFFFKQWGGVHKSKTGRTLDERTYDEMPSPPISIAALWTAAMIGYWLQHISINNDVVIHAEAPASVHLDDGEPVLPLIDWHVVRAQVTETSNDPTTNHRAINAAPVVLLPTVPVPDNRVDVCSIEYGFRDVDSSGATHLVSVQYA